MTKRDFTDLISAYQAMEGINKIIGVLTNGSKVSGKGLNGIYNLYDVIRRNSNHPGTDEESKEALDRILSNKKYTIRKMVELLYPEEKPIKVAKVAARTKVKTAKQIKAKTAAKTKPKKTSKFKAKA